MFFTTKQALKIISIILAACLIMPAMLNSAENKQKYKPKSAKVLKQLEVTATEARKFFYQGQFEQSIDIYKLLLKELTVNSPLYLCELGTCYWAAGDKESAKRIFMEAEVMLRGFYETKSEKKAASYWGLESSKVFKGDPYERSCLYLFLGLLMLDSGDIDNALASFKSAQLADSDVANQLYRSDFGLLQLLEGFCYLKRDQEDMYAQSINLALSSFQQSHPQVRSIVDRKQTLLGVQVNNDDKKKKNKKTEYDTADKLKEVNHDLEEAISNVDLSYCEAVKKNYNTLLLLWTGKSPVKQRYGEYGESRAIVKRPDKEANHYELLIDDELCIDGVRGFADISHQATTRGGRQMDNVLANQAAFKSFSSSFGNVMLDTANDVGGYAGLAMLAIGLISKGVSAATKVEADIRCWRLLPEELIIVPLNLKPGKHKIKIEHYDVLLKKQVCEIQTNISEVKPLNIIFTFPQAAVENKTN